MNMMHLKFIKKRIFYLIRQKKAKVGGGFYLDDACLL